MPAIADSLAGRMAVVSLLPFAQSEIHSTPGQMLDGLFAGDEPTIGEGAVFGEELMNVVLKGGYPEVLRRSAPTRRTAWLEDYFIDRDVSEGSIKPTANG